MLNRQSITPKRSISSPFNTEYSEEQLKAKIEYLQTENTQLHEQMSELENLLTLNRQALRITTNINKMPEQIENEDPNMGLMMVLKNIQDENENLQRMISNLIAERNDVQNQLLINQQIAEAAQRHEKELIAELEHKIQFLNKQLQEKEKIVASLEHTQITFDETSGIVIKYRDILSTEKAVIRLHDEIEMLNMQVVEQCKKINVLKKEKQDLQALNFKLNAELIKKKSQTPKNDEDQDSFRHDKSDKAENPEKKLVNVLKIQKNMLNAMNDSSVLSSSDEGESEPSSPLPIKNEVLMDKPKGMGIPKLDLTRAKQIQEINAKRQIQQMQEKQAKGIDFQVAEKISKLERSLDEVRRNLQREMMNNRTLETLNWELQRVNEELEHRNELLSKSNIQYEEKWRKLQRQYQFLYSFYNNNKDQLAYQPTTQTYSNNRKLQSPFGDPAQDGEQNFYEFEQDDQVPMQEVQDHYDNSLYSYPQEEQNPDGDNEVHNQEHEEIDDEHKESYNQ